MGLFNWTFSILNYKKYLFDGTEQLNHVYYLWRFISMKTLANLKPNEEAIVKQLKASELLPKLLEMGLYEGKKVMVLFKAPTGDPIAVQVGNYVLSMRKSEAEQIIIE